LRQVAALSALIAQEQFNPAIGSAFAEKRE